MIYKKYFYLFEGTEKLKFLDFRVQYLQNLHN